MTDDLPNDEPLLAAVEPEPEPPDFYETLGVDRNATEAQLKFAFRAAAKKHHPLHGGDADRFDEACLAYRALSREKVRKRYDKGGWDAIRDMVYHHEGHRDIFADIYDVIAPESADFFKLLEISESASSSDVLRAFRKLAPRCHPSLDKDNNWPEFREIVTAYHMLTKHRESAVNGWCFLPDGKSLQLWYAREVAAEIGFFAGIDPELIENDWSRVLELHREAFPPPEPITAEDRPSLAVLGDDDPSRRESVGAAQTAGRRLMAAIHDFGRALDADVVRTGDEKRDGAWLPMVEGIVLTLQENLPPSMTSLSYEIALGGMLFSEIEPSPEELQKQTHEQALTDSNYHATDGADDDDEPEADDDKLPDPKRRAELLARPFLRYIDQLEPPAGREDYETKIKRLMRDLANVLHDLEEDDAQRPPDPPKKNKGDQGIFEKGPFGPRA